MTGYPLFSYSDSDATFRVVAAAGTGVHVRIDLDQDPEAEGYGGSIIIHIGEPHQVRALIEALEPCADDQIDTALDQSQRQRQEAVYTARSALTSTGVLLRGSKIEPDAAALLVAVAGFVATGDRDYVLGDGQNLVRSDA